MKLLIIEQNLKLQMALTRSLEKSGHQTNAVKDGEEGLYEATNFPYDGVILKALALQKKRTVSCSSIQDRLHQKGEEVSQNCFIVHIYNLRKN